MPRRRKAVSLAAPLGAIALAPAAAAVINARLGMMADPTAPGLAGEMALMVTEKMEAGLEILTSKAMGAAVERQASLGVGLWSEMMASLGSPAALASAQLRWWSGTMANAERATQAVLPSLQRRVTANRRRLKA